jgi:hypothetical protein
MFFFLNLSHLSDGWGLWWFMLLGISLLIIREFTYSWVAYAKFPILVNIMHFFCFVIYFVVGIEFKKIFMAMNIVSLTWISLAWMLYPTYDGRRQTPLVRVVVAVRYCHVLSHPCMLVWGVKLCVSCEKIVVKVGCFF